MTPSIVVGTAGHIDHGKSALVRALTGIDPDRLKEERARGITIDLGFAHTAIAGVNVAFVDVPGHERFVKNMLAGAGGIDVVVLVVAADESIMPQTREHFHICRLLGVAAGVIVLSKSDLADGEMLELARLEVRQLVAGSFLADSPAIAVSTRTGEGLDELRAALARLADRVAERGREGATRLPIDRVFSVRGFGTVVTGTLVSGEIRVDQELELLPSGRRVKVRGLQVHGADETMAGAGRRLAVNLGGADVSEVQRGDTLVVPGTLLATRRADALVQVLPGGPALKHGGRVRVHHGTAERLARVSIGGSTERAGSLAEIAAGESAYVRLRLEAPVVLTRGDRFIIRAYSPMTTLGGGLVLDPAPPDGAVRTEAGWQRLRRLDGRTAFDESAAAAVVAFLDERGTSGLPTLALVSRGGLSPSAAEAVSARLIASGAAVAVADLLVSAPSLDALAAQLLAALGAHHTAEPLSEGLPREEARGRVLRRGPAPVFEHVVDRLAERGAIVARDRLALAGHRVSMSAEEARAHEALERVYRDGGLSPPDVSAAPAAAGVTPALADRMLALLVRQRTLVRVETLVFHSEALTRLKADIRGLKTLEKPEASVDVRAFKERFGVTRKFAIPLLEYLDRERVTRRVADRRVVL